MPDDASMDDMINQNQYPCVFELYGCDQWFEPIDKVAHEEVCDFRPSFCPQGGPFCAWQGEIHEVVDHLLQDHPEVLFNESNDASFLAAGIDTPTASNWGIILKCFNRHFLLTLTKHDEDEDKEAKWIAMVQLIGSREEAEQFVYRITLTGAGRRRLIWEATPHPTREAVTIAIRETNCLIFDSEIARLFSEENGLKVNVIISRVDD